MILKSLSQRWCCFLQRKFIQYFVYQEKLNSCLDFLIQLLLSFFLHVFRYFLLPESAFFNLLWVRMVFILICHLLKLMKPLNFWISNLIVDIFTLILLWCQVLQRIVMLWEQSLGLAQWKKSRTIVQREEEIKYSEVEKTNTQFNVVLLIKPIMCTFTEEERETILKLWKSAIRNTHTSR